MKMKVVVQGTLLLTLAWVAAAGADPTQKVDDRGMVVMQSDSDGNKTVHAYAPDGKRVKSESSRGERIHFGAAGHTTGHTPISAPAANQKVQP